MMAQMSTSTETRTMVSMVLPVRLYLVLFLSAITHFFPRPVAPEQSGKPLKQPRCRAIVWAQYREVDMVVMPAGIDRLAELQLDRRNVILVAMRQTRSHTCTAVRRRSP